MVLILFDLRSSVNGFLRLEASTMPSNLPISIDRLMILVVPW